MTTRRSALLKSTPSLIAMLTAGALMTPGTAHAIDAGALPENGTVVGGSASFDYSTPNKLDINQTTDRTVINWDSFNIGTEATTQFYQPNANSLAVNRVLSKGMDPTQILGKLIANGKVMVLDRNGVIFGKDSVVDVGGIIASTGDIDVNQVMSGANKIDLNNFGSGSIVNNGLINASQSGLVALVGPNAVNNGVINAKLGKVTLASGEAATVDLYGDGLVEIAANSNLTKALVSNTGTINAEGGTVQMTAQAAKDAVDNAVNMSGVVDVSSVSVQGGKIILGGNGTTKVSGKLKASGTSGGQVKVTSKNILLDTASNISADANVNGKGGTVDVIAENGLISAGSISAKGGAISGDGGAVDTSGKGWVNIFGIVDASAANGKNGTWLIDPTDLIISAFSGNVGGDGSSADPFAPDGDVSSYLKVSSIETALAGGSDVYITTVGSPNVGQSGTIYMYDPILKTSANDSVLHMSAAGSIYGGDISSTGSKLGLDFDAVGDISVGGIIDTNGGDVDFKSTNGFVLTATGSSLFTKGGDVTFTADGGRVYNYGAVSTAGGDFTSVSRDSFFNSDFTTNTTPSISTGGGDINISVTGPVIGFEGNVYNRGTLNAAGGNIKITQAGYVKSAANSIITSGSGTIGLQQVKSLDTSIQATIDAILNTGSGINTITLGAGIYAESLNADVANLVLASATPGAVTLTPLSGSGVSVLANNVTIKDLNILGASQYGVIVDGVNNATISGLNVTNSALDGIKINNSNGSVVSSNTVTNSGRVGIYAGTATNLLIDGNILNTNTFLIGSPYGAITADFGSGITVSNNIINNSTQGIRFYKVGGVNSASLNKISNVTNDGIYVIDTNGLTLSTNTISGTGKNGIYVDPSPGTVVTGNIIDNTASNGVYILNSANSVVSANYIGTLGGANNIHGEGVKVEGSNGTSVTGNFISNTKSSAADNGSGIYFLSSNGGTISQNTISNTGWDGIKLTSSNATIDSNVVNNASHYGIYTKWAPNVAINGNTVTGTGQIGIFADNSGGGLITITNNHVDAAGTDGIRVQAETNNAKVTGNFVGYGADGIFGTADDSVIGRDGIRLDGSDFVTVDSNFVGNAKRYGIVATNGKKIASGDIISNNFVDKTGNAGINILTAQDADVINNHVGTLGGANNIGSDGILIQSAVRTDVIGNTISNTKSSAADNGSGIYFLSSNGGTISQNTISNTGWDGIKLTSSNATIDSNVVNNASHYGIYTKWAPNVDIKNNTVAGTGQIGIFADNSGGGLITITNNHVDAAGTDGIRVQAETNNAKVTGNFVGYGADGIFGTADDSIIGRDGIRLDGSDLVTVDSNFVANTKRYGIVATNGKKIASGDIISNNFVDKTGNAGIYLLVAEDADVTNNHVGTLGGVNNIVGDGILAQNAIRTDVIGNTISNTKSSAADNGSGIYLLNSNGGNIVQNTISNAGWDGIKLTSSNATIDSNIVNNASHYGIYTKWAPNVAINGNTVTGTGQIGIFADNSGGGLITITDNHVDAAGTDGIRVQATTNNAKVTGNYVGYGADGIFGTADDSVIGRDGIRIDGSDFVTLDGNFIANADRYGIAVTNGKKIASGNIINNNFVDNTGKAGVYLLVAEDTDVTNNHIGTLGGVNNIGGDGVLAQNAVRTDVIGNTISNTTSPAADIGSGVHLLDSDGSFVFNNVISNAEWDGVKITSSDNVTVDQNTMSNLTRVGVYALDSGNTTVTNNVITNADLYGVRMLDATGITLISGNQINDIADTGIVVLGASDLRIQGNFIGLGADNVAGTADDTVIGNNGIEVANALLASVINNLVANAANSGARFDLGVANTGTIANNEIANSDIGMYFQSGLIDLTGAANTITGGRVGYHFEPTVADSVNLVGNTIGSTVFNGQSQFYVELANGALFNPGTPTVIDGTLASYDGYLPNVDGLNMSQAQYDILENGIYHFADDNTMGLFFFGFPPVSVLIDQNDIFRDIAGVPGAAGRFSITIQGMPRIPGVTTPASFASGGGQNFALNNITPAAGGASALNNIATAAGDEDNQTTNTQTAQNVQNVEPAAGGNAVEANSWGAAVDAAARGQSATFSFSGDGADLMRTEGL